MALALGSVSQTRICCCGIGILVLWLSAAWKSHVAGTTQHLAEVVAAGRVWVSDVTLLTLRLFKGTFQREEPFCSSE